VGSNINYIQIILITVLAIFGIFLFFFLRNSPGNNMRRARKHHKLGERYYEKEDHEEAKLHYELAKFYREKAIEQREK